MMGTQDKNPLDPELVSIDQLTTDELIAAIDSLSYALSRMAETLAERCNVTPEAPDQLQ